ncbi:MAG TPA: hypothetical protein VID19_05605 [Candidatus Eremiobacteraceae bacterium]
MSRQSNRATIAGIAAVFAVGAAIVGAAPHADVSSSRSVASWISPIPTVTPLATPAPSPSPTISSTPTASPSASPSIVPSLGPSYAPRTAATG